MPITPMDILPVALTSVSLKRIHMPCLVTRKISVSASVDFNLNQFIVIAQIDRGKAVLRTLLYSITGVFFTIPFLVTMNRFLLSS